MGIKTSLQILKNDLLKKENIRRTLYTNYSQLIHLSEKQLCIYFEVYSLDSLENIKLQPQLSKKKHLPICHCTDSQSKPKDLYQSEVSAHKQILQSKEKLKIYPCANTSGWHLSKG